jgi:hypothetical protein
MNKPDTANTAQTANPALESRDRLNQARKQGLSIASGILARATGMVVASKEEYDAADVVLARLRDKRVHIMSKLIDPLKKPINEAHDRVMALEHELVDPLTAAEKILKNKMGLWAQRERRIAQERADAERQERERLEAEQREKQREADRAQAAGKLSRAQILRHEATELADQAEEMAAAPPVQAQTQAARSTAVTIKKWRVSDLHAVLQGILNGVTPEGIVQVNAVVVNQYMRGDPSGEVVGGWPGMEVYDDVQIRGKG